MKTLKLNKKTSTEILTNLVFMMKKIIGIFLGLIVSCKNQGEPKHHRLEDRKPLIIAHRGASGYLPEHTIEAYQKAIDLGADYIEPDLVMTKDGVLVVRHEPMLSQTTNISELDQFIHHKKKRKLDGVWVEDWFVCDLNLEEIKALKARQAFPDRPQNLNDQFEIPTFEEVIQLVLEQKHEVGIYPETKHPKFHQEIDLALTDTLLQVLNKYGLNSAKSPVFIQSFEVENLQNIRAESTVKTIQLISAGGVNQDGTLDFQIRADRAISEVMPYDFYIHGDGRSYKDLITDEGLDFIQTYANGIGVWKPFIIPYDSNFQALKHTDIIDRAHEKGLLIHAYTFRNESKRLLTNYNNKPELEYKAFYALGLDGVFTDFIETAKKAMD